LLIPSSDELECLPALISELEGLLMASRSLEEYEPVLNGWPRLAAFFFTESERIFSTIFESDHGFLPRSDNFQMDDDGDEFRKDLGDREPLTLVPSEETSEFLSLLGVCFCSTCRFSGFLSMVKVEPTGEGVFDDGGMTGTALPVSAAGSRFSRCGARRDLFSKLLSSLSTTPEVEGDAGLMLDKNSFQSEIMSTPEDRLSCLSSGVTGAVWFAASSAAET
jgi:hypothetical protein